jgi:hypothetical protein
MSSATKHAGSESCDALPPLFINSRVLHALRLQIAILEIRSKPCRSVELEPFFTSVEALLRDLVHEAGAD